MAGVGNTRTQIVEAADRLFYENGFEATSFADIATSLDISRGNFYYHFRTKDEILDAVIAMRLAETSRMLEDWEAEAGNPLGRMGRFVDILIRNKAKIMAHGCPVGTLCNELAKLDHPAQPRSRELFRLFRDWLARQFVAAGRVEDADRLALHLLMRSQGVAVLATAFRDDAFVAREVDDMHAWLERECSDAGSSRNTIAPLQP